jgi:hypothetical protein
MPNEEEIKKISDDINTANIENLLQYKRTGAVSRVEVFAGNGSCEKCKSQNGKIFTVEDAIKTRPLPCKECDHEMGYCRCVYLPVAK